MFSLCIYGCLFLISNVLLKPSDLPAYEAFNVKSTLIECDAKPEPESSKEKKDFVQTFTAVVYSQTTLRTLCYGLAFSEFQILTSAQCFLEPQSEDLKDLNEFRVLPDANTPSKGKNFGIIYKVKSVGLHVDFKIKAEFNIVENDIAAATLDRSLSYSGLKYPFPMYSDDHETRGKVSRRLTTLECYTFGSLQMYIKLDKIKKMQAGVFNVQVVATRKCDELYRMNKTTDKKAKVFSSAACAYLDYNMEGEQCFDFCIAVHPNSPFIQCGRTSRFYLKELGSPLICENSVFGILSTTVHPFYFPHIYVLFNQELKFKSEAPEKIFNIFS